MQHLLLAITAYAAFVLQIVCGATWSEAGVAVDLLLLAAMLPLFLVEGTAVVGWVALFGMLGDVLQRGPLGIGLGVGIVATMAVGPLIARRRSTSERLLGAGLFLAGTSFVTHLARGLAGGLAGTTPVVDPALAFTIALHTVLAGCVVGAVALTFRTLLHRRLVRRY